MKENITFAVYVTTDNGTILHTVKIEKWQLTYSSEQDYIKKKFLLYMKVEYTQWIGTSSSMKDWTFIQIG